ncbi:MAG TPA: hypothetical protein VGP81_08815 [Pyrinomonadaceae bacterium]|jgi:hypothetical protein|nr:hypothetical protein [Pyrinomonadaceae bacterium]
MRYSVQILSLCSIVLMLIAGCSQSGGQQSSSQSTPPPSFGDPQSAAQRGLETFRRLVTSANAKELGFESTDEVAAASLGAPNQVFSVSLEQLKSYQPGGDANRMLADANRTIFPVMVRDQARASITVEQSNGKWTATGFGDPKLARQISAATKNTSAQGAPMIVHVLPFNLYFVGSRSDNRLMLTPLGDYSSFNVKTGATLSADEVFSALAPFAKNYNGLPM